MEITNKKPYWTLVVAGLCVVFAVTSIAIIKPEIMLGVAIPVGLIVGFLMTLFGWGDADDRANPKFHRFRLFGPLLLSVGVVGVGLLALLHHLGVIK